jgi:hypothetical protein
MMQATPDEPGGDPPAPESTFEPAAEPKAAETKEAETAEAKPQAAEAPSEAAYEPTPEEGVALRSRPPIFFFWPTLVLALLFTPLMGLMEEGTVVSGPEEAAPQSEAAPAEAEPNAEETVAQEAPTETPWWQRRLGRSVSLWLLLLLSLVMVAYLVTQVFPFFSRTALAESVHQLTGKRLLWRLSLMDLFHMVILVFLVLHPAYGLLALLAFYAFGMMTEHEMFTRVERLRNGMFWVVGGIVAAVALEVLRGQPAQQVFWQAPPGVGGTMAAIFFGLLAFNMFVLAFDFNGGTLVGLVSAVLGLVALVVLLHMTVSPKVGQFFLGLLGGLKHLQINASVYQAWAFVLSALMVFSGFIAKADFWQITPMAIVHHQGIIVQRTRHYGALMNFHYYVEYPDFFESILGGQAGTFILSLPREERPEVIEHVWYARHYNRQIQYLLAELPTADMPGVG